MANVLLHTLIFSPDMVSTSYIMTDMARQLLRHGHRVTVLTTTPHYSLDSAALKKQPLNRHWPILLYHSQFQGIPIWHIKIPMKHGRVLTRILDYVHFHAMSLLVGSTKLNRPDIIIAPSPPLTIGVIGWLLGLKWRVPFVYNVQEIYPDFAINQGLITNQMLIKLLRRLERFVYDRSTAIVCISERFRSIIEKRGVPEGKLHVIPNSVDTELFRPLSRSNAFAERHGLLNDFIVLYAGNIGLSQDWDSLLYAAGKLSHLPIRFLVVGEGVRKRWLEKECLSGKFANVRIMGYQPRDTAPEVYATSDVCIIPMKANSTIDTFPSKIYTIMACGRSAIVQADSDSELNSLIGSARGGRVTPPGDPESFTESILKAFREKKELEAEGTRARQFVVERYSSEAIGKKYSQLIHKLTEKGLN